MAARSFLRLLLVGVAVIVTVATVGNVFLDDGDVRAQAAALACGAARCAGEGPIRVDRTPLSETLDFVTRAGRTVTIECRRRAIAVGPYACRRADEEAAVTPVQRAH